MIPELMLRVSMFAVHCQDKVTRPKICQCCLHDCLNNLSEKRWHCPVQEIAPFLRVLGCYPMDLDAGDAASVLSSQDEFGTDDRALNGGGSLVMRSDDLLMAVTGASVRIPAMQVCSFVKHRTSFSHAYNTALNGWVHIAQYIDQMAFVP